MKAIVGISMMLAALSSGFFTPAVLANEQTATTPASVGPSVLYFAPAAERNMALDAAMIEWLHDGVQVTYVTDAAQFVYALGGAWDAVVVVDIPESELDTGVLAGAADYTPTVMRIDTGGPVSQVCTEVIDFHGTPGEGGWEPLEGTETGAKKLMVPWGCLAEWIRCALSCGASFLLTDSRLAKCNQCCNNAEAKCEQGSPMSVDCVRVAKGEDADPFAPRKTGTVDPTTPPDSGGQEGGTADPGQGETHP